MVDHNKSTETRSTQRIPSSVNIRETKLAKHHATPLCIRRLLSRFRPGSRDLRAALIFLAAGLLIISCALSVLIQLPQAPYNIRELFGERNLFISIPLFAAFLIWVGALPNILARITIICPVLHLAQPLGFLAMAAPSWLLLSLSVSTESLLDILGTPVLGWPGDWELFIRYLAFIAPFQLSLYYWNLLMEGSALLNRRFGFGQLLSALFLGLPILWLSKYIVIDNPATDNIIQLSAQGPQWFIGGALIGIIALATLNGVLLAWAWLSDLVYRVLLCILTPLVFGICTWLATEALSENALMFLLGAEQGYQDGAKELLMRWGLLYFVVVALTGFSHLIPFRLRGTSHTQREAINAGSYPQPYRPRLTPALGANAAP